MHKRLDYTYELPEELIAYRPAFKRRGSRLLVMEAGNGCHFRHERFGQILDYLRSDDLLVFNNTQVIPARIFCRKLPGGASGEILIEKFLPERRILCQLKFARSPRPGQRLLIESSQEALEAEVCGRQGRFFEIQFDSEDSPLSIVQRVGVMPLPPYIKRPADEQDDRYQTVYASRPGAVAAPTAGLHFDQDLLDTLASKGVNRCELTLHVASGTFQPVRVEDIRQHSMHGEWYEVSADVVASIKACRARKGRVIAVGTTSVRALESSVAEGGLQPCAGETNIFIYPPYDFQVVDGMITNFHMPSSSLLMLVCAFAGYEATMRAYADAVQKRYRFLSYCDAMPILPSTHVV